jgi:hypothetical protein
VRADAFPPCGGRDLPPQGRWDLVVATGLFVAAAVYVGALPRNLGTADESYFLLEAKRVAEGETLYRDVFYYATPGAHWLMAMLFAGFGTDLAVARVAMAVLHGMTCAVLFASARQLGIHRGLAVAVPLAYLALAQPAWPYASYHWLSTCLMTALVYVLLRRPPHAGAVWWLRPGLVVGAIVAVQQQKGVALGGGVAVLCVLESITLGRDAIVRRAVGGLAWLCAGALAVAAPVMVAVLATAGWRPVWQQLVVYPLTDYRTLNQSGWGEVDFLNLGLAQYTLPRVLAELPMLAAVSALRAAWQWVAAHDATRAWPLLVLAVMGGAAALSVAYLPDFIHLAFIAPIGLLCAAEALDALGRAVERRHVAAPVRAATAALLGVALAGWLARGYARAHGEFPLPHQTAFGRVDFATPQEIELVERVRGLFADTPTREFFAYPVYTSLYLTTDTDNPTPNQVLILGHSSLAQMTQAADVLRTRRLPYLFVCHWPLPAHEPVSEYIDATYEPLAPGYRLGGSNCDIMRRRD